MNATCAKSLKNRVDRNVKHAKKRTKPEQKKVQAEYDHQQFIKLLEKGITAAEAKVIVERNRANDYQILDDSHILYFCDGRVCSILEAIELDLFGESLADPIEGIEYGTTTAQFIKRKGQPFIRSMAHGGRDYRIVSKKLYDVYAVDADPGVGKTRAICAKICKMYRRGESICIVVPTTKLMQQYRNDLMQLGIGSNEICLLYSAENNIAVGNQLGFALNDKRRLILITHAHLKMMKRQMYKRMADYNVFIDEVFYAMDFCQYFDLKYCVKDDGILKQYCDWEPIPYVKDTYKLHLKKEQRKALNAQLAKTDAKKSLSTRNTNVILRMLKNSAIQVIISKMNRSDEGNYCIASMYNCSNLRFFKSCTIASAFVKQTEIYHWLNLEFNMVDVTAEYCSSFQNLDNRMKELTVMPFVDHYTKYVRDRLGFCKIGNEKIIKPQQFVNRVIKNCSYFDADTLRVLNNDDFFKFDDDKYVLISGQFVEGKQMSSQVHGQNDYQHLNSAVIVAAFNLPPHKNAFLKKLLPFYDSWLERNVFTTVQCFMRTSLRDKDSDKKVYVMVPDKRTCEAIIKLFDDLPKMGSHCLAAEYKVA